MKLSLKWLKQFVEIPEHLSAKDLANLMTLHTAEVDGFENPSENFANMVVGKIVELKPHPNADKLQVCIVDIGETGFDSQMDSDTRQNSKSKANRTNSTKSDFLDFNEVDKSISESSKKVKIVCGGRNLYQNQLVAIALPGSQVRWHGKGDLITLEATTIRGEDSYGMICAAEEIGMGQSKGKEIMDLTELNVEPGTPLDKALGQDDIIFDIDNKAITHRPDLWCHYGFAREISAITGGKLKPYPHANLDSKIPAKGEELNLKITNPEILSKWTSLVINNITVQESPNWLKHKIESVGLRSVNNIVDITNLIMLELGQPMHAYDKNLLDPNLELEIRFANDQEKLETIDHKHRELTSQDPILINAKDNTPVIILGVMGGANSEISEQTTNIVLESATFDAVTIRKSSTYHGLRSDASQRFEKSLDQNLCLPALLKAAELILELCPEAQIAGPVTNQTITEQAELTITLNPEKVSKYLGFKIPTAKITEILTSLSFELTENKDQTLQIKVPTFRATKDIQNEVDLIEEVVRIYGYEQINEVLPVLPTKAPYKNVARSREHQAREILKGYGLSEVLNYSFYSKQDYENALLAEKNHLTLKNYLSEEQTHLRTSLLPNILKNIHLNNKNFAETKIFEIGRTYLENGNYFPTEEEHIAIAIYKSQDPFTELKGILEAFLNQFSHQPLSIIVNQDPVSYLHPKKSIQIVDENNVEIGFAGIVHPLVQENFDLKNEIAYAEINFARLTHQVAYAKKFSPIPKFPDLEFDLSIVIDADQYAETIQKAIHQSSDLIQSTKLFDIYQGQSLGKNKKALAYKITLRSLDRTLTDQDLSTVQEACIQNIKKAGGTVRGYE